MDNLELNIDEMINSLVLEIANLKKELVIEKAKNNALHKLSEEEKVAE